MKAAEGLFLKSYFHIIIMNTDKKKDIISLSNAFKKKIMADLIGSPCINSNCFFSSEATL